MRQRKVGSGESLYEMARAIASKKAGRRSYREDVISEAYLAVAEGTASDQGSIENAVRRSKRGEWSLQSRRVSSLEIADSLMRVGAPERARPDIYGALAVLTPRQRAVVILTFWDGLTQEEIAAELGIPRRTVCYVLESSLEYMKKFLSLIAKTSGENAVYM